MVYPQHIEYSVQPYKVVCDKTEMQNKAEIAVKCIADRDSVNTFFSNVLKDIADSGKRELYIYGQSSFDDTELPLMNRCPADIFGRYQEIIQETPSAAGYMCITFRYKLLLKSAQYNISNGVLQSLLYKEFTIAPLPEFIMEMPFYRGNNVISPYSFADIFMGCSVQGSKANIFLNSMKPKIMHYNDMMEWDILMKRILYAGARAVSTSDFVSKNPDGFYRYIISRQDMHMAYRSFSYFTDLKGDIVDMLIHSLTVKNLSDWCCKNLHDDKFFPNVSEVKRAVDTFSITPVILTIDTADAGRKNFPMEIRLIQTVLKEQYSRYFNFPI